MSSACTQCATVIRARPQYVVSTPCTGLRDCLRAVFTAICVSRACLLVKMRLVCMTVMQRHFDWLAMVDVVYSDWCCWTWCRVSASLHAATLLAATFHSCRNRSKYDNCIIGIKLFLALDHEYFTSAWFCCAVDKLGLCYWLLAAINVAQLRASINLCILW